MFPHQGIVHSKRAEYNDIECSKFKSVPCIFECRWFTWVGLLRRIWSLESSSQAIFLTSHRNCRVLIWKDLNLACLESNYFFKYVCEGTIEIGDLRGPKQNQSCEKRQIFGDDHMSNTGHVHRKMEGSGKRNWENAFKRAPCFSWNNQCRAIRGFSRTT